MTLHVITCTGSLEGIVQQFKVVNASMLFETRATCDIVQNVLQGDRKLNLEMFCDVCGSWN